MIRNEICSMGLKLWAICVICFFVFCISRALNHFPKRTDKDASLSVRFNEYQKATVLQDGSVFYRGNEEAIEVYEAKKTNGNSYEIIRRVK